MKIVVLDGYTLNPGDLTWDGLKAFGEVEIYDRTPANLVMERAEGAQIILTNKTPLNKTHFARLPDLKYIGVLATGYNVVDVDGAREAGIIVTNIPTYGTMSVAQMVFALLLELCHRVQRHSDSVLSGEWTNNIDWCYWKNPLIELAGKTLGIIGYGRIGRQVAGIAAAFGMKIVAYDLYSGQPQDLPDFRWVELEELLSISDVVSLHCPLFPATAGIINKNSLSKMKSSAFLINTSRGPLVIEQDLADALQQGIIAGAALDVLGSEPPLANNPLLAAPNIILTPHISWATKEARTRLMGIAVNNVQAFLAGNPVNCVNKQ